MEDKKSILLRLSPEAKVGLFVLAGIALLAYMSLRLGGIRLGRAEGYTLHVTFDSAAGLDKDASIRVAGVEVGKVKEIALKDSRARLTLQINKGMEIRKDFMAVLTTKGLLGEKYLELIPGSPNAPLLEDGSELTSTKTYVGMDTLMTVLSEVAGDLKNVSETLGKVLGGSEGEVTLRNILKNIEGISAQLNKTIASNDERLDRIMTNLDEFAALMRNEGPQVTTGLKQAVETARDAMSKISENFNNLVNENRGGLKEGVDNLRLASLKLQEAMDNLNKITQETGPRLSEATGTFGNIAKKIDAGEGTLGKLINDPSMHENINKAITGVNKYIEKAESIHTYLGYRPEYLFDAKDAKSYFTLKIQPKSDKYYLIEVVDDPSGKRRKETRDTTAAGATTTITEVKTSDSLKFSAQIAKGFGNLTLRAGIIESSGGAGIDYYMFRKKARLTLEAFDFNKKGGAHAKAGVNIYLGKYFYLIAGADDFANKSTASAYAGLGFQFEDEDIKYLLGSVPSVSVQ